MRTGLAILLAAGGLSLTAGAGALGGATPAYADGYYAAIPFDQTACWTYGWAGTLDYPYCGWFDGFFYPGSGIYVYGRDRQRHVWNPDQQNHWGARSPALSNGMHSPGPVRIPGTFGGHSFGPGPAQIGGGLSGNRGAGVGGGSFSGPGFGPGPAQIGGGLGGNRGGGRGFGGGGFGGGRGSGGGHGSGGHSGR